MNDTRKGPWLSGLAAAIVVAVVLIVTAAAGTAHVLSGVPDTDPTSDMSYTP